MFINLRCLGGNLHVSSQSVSLILPQVFLIGNNPSCVIHCIKLRLLLKSLNLSDKMKAYFNGAAEVDPRESGKFAMLGGMITGTYLEIQPNESVSYSRL